MFKIGDIIIGIKGQNDYKYTDENAICKVVRIRKYAVESIGVVILEYLPRHLYYGGQVGFVTEDKPWFVDPTQFQFFDKEKYEKIKHLSPLEQKIEYLYDKQKFKFNPTERIAADHV